MSTHTSALDWVGVVFVAGDAHAVGLPLLPTLTVKRKLRGDDPARGPVHIGRFEGRDCRRPKSDFHL